MKNQECMTVPRIDIHSKIELKTTKFQTFSQSTRVTTSCSTFFSKIEFFKQTKLQSNKNTTKESEKPYIHQYFCLKSSYSDEIIKTFTCIFASNTIRPVCSIFYEPATSTSISLPPTDGTS